MKLKLTGGCENVKPFLSLELFLPEETPHEQIKDVVLDSVYDYLMHYGYLPENVIDTGGDSRTIGDKIRDLYFPWDPECRFELSVNLEGIHSSRVKDVVLEAVYETLVKGDYGYSDCEHGHGVIDDKRPICEKLRTFHFDGKKPE